MEESYLNLIPVIPYFNTDIIGISVARLSMYQRHMDNIFYNNEIDCPFGTQHYALRHFNLHDFGIIYIYDELELCKGHRRVYDAFLFPYI